MSEPTDGNAEQANTRSKPHPTVDFTTLVLSIHESALELLGAKGDLPKEELTAARYQIDMLELLQVKTRGNLTDDEDRLLRTVLYELRTAYVRTKSGDPNAAAKGPAPDAAPDAKK